MTTQTITPNVTVSNVGWTVGAGTIPASLADSDDATYAQQDQSGLCVLYQGLTSYTLAANERCYGARSITRARNNHDAPVMEVDLVDPVTGLAYLESLESPPSGYGNYTGPWITQLSRLVGYGAGLNTMWMQADIDNLQLLIMQKAAVPTGSLRVARAVVELDIRHQPIVSAVSAPTGVQASRIPTVSWTPAWQDGDDGYQTRIKVFKAATYGAGGFNPETTPADGYDVTVYDNNATAHSYTPSNINANYLGDGTWKAYVKTSKIFLPAFPYEDWAWTSDWVAGPAFTITNPPPAPTTLTPANASTVNTDLPTLGATVVEPTMHAKSTVQWQLATDIAFTANARTISETSADLRLSGITTEVIPAPSALFQGAGVPGVWYMRARQVDQFGTTGAYTAAQSFNVSHPPAPSNITPGSAIVLGFDTGTVGASVTASWDFTDTSPVDFQTAYQVVVERNDTGASVLDSGKVLSTSATTYVMVIPVATYQDVLLRLKVRLWDRDDVPGGYSAYQTFMVQENPVVTITSPLDLDMVNNPAPTVLWSLTAGGRTQNRYRVLFGLGPSATPGDAVYDTLWQGDVVTTFTPPTAILENDTNYWVEVQVYDSSNLYASDRTYFDTHWIPPASPAFVVDDTPYNEDLDDGYVKITWTDVDRDPSFEAYRLYRRLVDADDWEMLLETSDIEAEYEYHDWLAVSGVEYEYSLTQVATRFGASVEGLGDSLPSFPVSTHYWLIHPDDASLNLRLAHVTSDDFEDDEWETKTTHILGAGRHVDIGDRLGETGTLGFNLRDIEGGLTAREQRFQIKALRATETTIYLRNPFGDIYLVHAGNVRIRRQSGVGRREFSDVSLDYEEMAS